MIGKESYIPLSPNSKPRHHGAAKDTLGPPIQLSPLPAGEGSWTPVQEDGLDLALRDHQQLPLSVPPGRTVEDLELQDRGAFREDLEDFGHHGLRGKTTAFVVDLYDPTIVCELLMKGEWLSGWMNEWMNELMNEWMNEWVDGRVNEWMRVDWMTSSDLQVTQVTYSHAHGNKMHISYKDNQTQTKHYDQSGRTNTLFTSAILLSSPRQRAVYF